MKINKKLLGLTTLIGLFSLFIIGTGVSANASRLPNNLTGHWYTNHVAGNSDHINMYLHHYSGYYDDSDGGVHMHMAHFTPQAHGWYSYHCYTYPMPFKLINKNTLKMQNGVNYYIHLHRVNHTTSTPKYMKSEFTQTNNGKKLKKCNYGYDEAYLNYDTKLECVYSNYYPNNKKSYISKSLSLSKSNDVFWINGKTNMIYKYIGKRTWKHVSNNYFKRTMLKAVKYAKDVLA